MIIRGNSTKTEKQKDLGQQDEWALEHHLKLNVDKHKAVHMGKNVTLAIK